jgi:hypothetical protein
MRTHAETIQLAATITTPAMRLSFLCRWDFKIGRFGFTEHECRQTLALSVRKDSLMGRFIKFGWKMRHRIITRGLMLVWLIGMLIQTPLRAGSDITKSQSQDPTYFLLTRKSDNGSWRYLLHKGPTFRDAIKRDGRGKEGSMTELKKELLKHPSDMIFWSSSRSLKFEYPSREQMNEILAFAQTHHIYLQVLPTIEE